MIAYDGDQPVGYVFANTEILTSETFKERPNWAEQFSNDSQWLFPDWLQTPVRVAELNNLYVSPEYRGEHIGSHLTQHAMNWLRFKSEAPHIFVFVSNGNNAAPLYEKLGFSHSHEVLDGLIQSYYLDNTMNFSQ